MRGRFSPLGLALALGFVGLAVLAYLQHTHSVKTNPADSGESPLLVFFLSLPWSLISAWILNPLHLKPENPFVLVWAGVGLNAVVIYLAVAKARRR